MASEWTEACLGHVCAFAGGTAFPKRYQGSADGHIPFIKVSDMNLSTNTRKIVVANNWIDEEVANRIRARRHPAEAIVFAKIGVALTYNRRRILTQPTVIDNNMMTAIPDCDAVDPLFLYYLLTTVDFNTVVAGTALPYLNAGDLSKLPIELPSDKDEQRAIAHILGTLDDKIEVNRRMSETLEAMARALFKSWFVDFDPVRAKAEGRDPGLPQPLADLFPARLVDSELGEIPEGWEVGTLADVADVVRGLSYKGSGLSDHGVPMHNLNSIHEGGGYKHDGVKFYRGDYQERHEARAGDLIVANTEQGHDRLLIGYAAVVPARFAGLSLFSHHIYRARVRPDSWLTPDYLCQLLNSAAMHHVVSGYANGTTVNMLPLDALQMPEIVVPTESLVETFSAIATTARRRHEETIAESSTLAFLRDALLPKLISGELRIREAERFVAKAALRTDEVVS